MQSSCEYATVYYTRRASPLPTNYHCGSIACKPKYTPFISEFEYPAHLLLSTSLEHLTPLKQFILHSIEPLSIVLFLYQTLHAVYGLYIVKV
jgi:hypothetical protein